MRGSILVLPLLQLRLLVSWTSVWRGSIWIDWESAPSSFHPTADPGAALSCKTVVHANSANICRRFKQFGGAEVDADEIPNPKRLHEIPQTPCRVLILLTTDWKQWRLQTFSLWRTNPWFPFNTCPRGHVVRRTLLPKWCILEIDNGSALRLLYHYFITWEFRKKIQRQDTCQNLFCAKKSYLLTHADVVPFGFTDILLILKGSIPPDYCREVWRGK